MPLWRAAVRSWLPFRRRHRGNASRASTASLLRRTRYRRPLFETLEMRRLLATYTWDIAASTLLIELDGEALTVFQSGSNFLFTSTSNFFASGGDVANGHGTTTIT